MIKPLVRKVVVGPIQTNCYVVECPETGAVLVIDPGDDSFGNSPILGLLVDVVHGIALGQLHHAGAQGLQFYLKCCNSTGIAPGHNFFPTPDGLAQSLQVGLGLHFFFYSGIKGLIEPIKPRHHLI